MGVFDRLERGLERAVKAPFAKVFKAEVQPVEIASAIRGAMDERGAVLGPGRTMVPNVFTVELASSDFERLASYDTALTDELVAAAEDHADAQRYTPAGVMEVRLTSHEELETGIFRVRPASKASDRATSSRMTPARPQQRPPGMPSNYQQQRQQPPPQQFQPPPQQQRPQQQPAGMPPGPPMRQGPPGPGYQQGPSRPSYDPQQFRPPQQQQQQQQQQGGQTREFPAVAPPRQPAQASRSPQPWVEIDGREHRLTAAVTTLGRDESADIVLNDPGASRRHAELRISHDGPHLRVIVRDLGSTNGTYRNGDRVGDDQLADGDRLTMGRSTITFHTGGRR